MAGSEAGEFENRGPGEVADVARLERDHRTTHDGEIAVEIEVFGEGTVLLKQNIAHPVVADFTTSPVTAHQSRETCGRLRDETAEVVTDGHLALFAGSRAGGPSVLGDHREAAHVRQSAGDGLDGEDFDSPVFYPTVPAIFRVAAKRGEPAAAMRWASARAVGWLPLS